MTEYRPDPHIRAARTEDCQSIVAIHLQAWRETYKGLLSAQYLAGLEHTIDRRLTWYRQTIESGQPSILLAEREQQLAGFCTFGTSHDEDATADSAEIMAIYLLAAAQRQGIGWALLNQARDHLIATGYRRAHVWVLDGNTRAIDFYKQAGFVADISSSRVFEKGAEALLLTRLSMYL